MSFEYMLANGAAIRVSAATVAKHIIRRLVAWIFLSSVNEMLDLYIGWFSGRKGVFNFANFRLITDSPTQGLGAGL